MSGRRWGSLWAFSVGLSALSDHDVDVRPGQPSTALSPPKNLAEVDDVCLWAEGIGVTTRPRERKLCLLVMIGVRTDGHTTLAALSDGSV